MEIRTCTVIDVGTHAILMQEIFKLEVQITAFLTAWSAWAAYMWFSELTTRLYA